MTAIVTKQVKSKRDEKDLVDLLKKMDRKLVGNTLEVAANGNSIKGSILNVCCEAETVKFSVAVGPASKIETYTVGNTPQSQYDFGHHFRFTIYR